MRALIDKYTSVIIVLAAGVLYLPFLGSVRLFDWDEINFAECAREMLITGNYLSIQLNYLPFWEKPPLFIWLSALSMKLLGVNEFAARFPNAVCGILTLVILYRIGLRIFKPRLALLWVLCYAGSTLPLFYFKTGIIDPWFNLFIFLGIYFFILFSFKTKTGEKRNVLFNLILSSLFIGLAVLTKGPVAFLIYAACVFIYMISRKFKKVMSVPHFLLGLSTIVAVGGIWFLLLVLQGKEEVIRNFVNYQVHLFQTEDSGHGGPFYYHFLVLLFGCFPASVFAIRGLVLKGKENDLQKHFSLFMKILFWVVLLLFSVVKTKIIHYSSLCYFPLTFMAAYTINEILEGNTHWKKWMSVLLLFIGGLLAMLLSLIPLVERLKYALIENDWITDSFTRENLKADVHWSGWEVLIGCISLASVLVAVFLVKKQMIKRALVLLFSTNMLVVVLAALVLAPKIEQYSQAAAIDFYESKQNESCYVTALGYHSYAQYFYARRQPESDPQRHSTEWMLIGDIDKPAYFVTKISNVEEHREANPQLTEIGSKNGFVFFKRELTGK